MNKDKTIDVLRPVDWVEYDKTRSLIIQEIVEYNHDLVGLKKALNTLQANRSRKD
jgi:hypothetical protein